MRRSLKIVQKTVVIMIIALGVMVGALRAGLPVISQFSAQINLWLSELIGIPLHIRQLQVSWTGAAPQLRLVDVRIMDETRSNVLMGFTQIRVELDTLATLRTGTLQTGMIQIVGARINITQRDNGEIHVDGLPDFAPSETPMDDQWLANLAKIAIIDSTLSIKKGRFRFEYTDLDLVLSNQDDLHKIHGEALLANVAQNRVAFAGEWTGPLLHPERAVGKFYLQADRFAIASLPINTTYQGVDVERGFLDLKLWARWDNLKLARMTGDLKLSEVTLSAQERMQIATFQSQFDWLDSDTQRSLNFKHAKLQITPQAKPMQVDFALQRDKGADTGALVVNLDALDLTQALAWFNLLDQDGQITKLLKQIQPRGELRDFRFSSPLVDGPFQFKASGHVLGLTTNSYGDSIPAIERWQIAFAATEQQGGMHISSAHSKVDFNTLFRAPLTLNRLDGRLFWRKQAQGWWLTGQQWHVDTPDLETTSNFHLLLPRAADISPYLDLRMSFANGDIANAHRYYPVAIMAQDVVNWLDLGLTSGRVTDGVAIVRGQLADFPFDTGRGRFEVNFNVDDMLLNYQTGWPVIKQLGANVVFAEDRMEIFAERGKIFNADLRDTYVAINRLSEDGSPLIVQGSVQGQVGDSLQYLRASPLWSDVKEWMAGMRGQGTHRVKLDLLIPLDDRPSRVRTDIQFFNAQVEKKGQFLLKRVTGGLTYANDKVSAKGLQAEFMAMPVMIDIDFLQGAGALSHATLITVQGEFTAAQLPAPWKTMITGKTPWQASLIMPEHTGGQAVSSKLEVTSDLRGLTIDLPQPFAKKANTPRHILFSTYVGEALPSARLQYGDIVNGIIEYQADKADHQLLRGNLHFGTGKATLPEGRGLSLSGTIGETSLPQWRAWYARHFTAAHKVSSPIALSNVDVQVEKIEVIGGHYKKLALTLQHGAQSWRGRVQCAGAEGTFTIPTDFSRNQPINITLKHFHFWKKDENAPVQAASTQPIETPDPWSIPPINLHIDKLFYHGANLGQLELHTQPAENALLLDTLQLKSAYINVQATGRWEKKAQETSSIRVQFNTPKLSKTLELLGFVGTLQDGKTVAEATLNWPDSPMNFSKEKLQGKAGLEIGKGRFLDIEPGVGRAFGLLSLGTIQRRLSFDFSDLFSKGFAFDRIGGQLSIDQGQAYTDNLYIDGPAALVEIIGETDLVHERYDQIVKVTPKVTDSATLASAILGGPLVGAGVWVAQKIVGGVIDESIQSVYAVDGAWHQPEVTKLDQNNATGILKKFDLSLPALKLPKLRDFGLSFDEMEDEEVFEFEDN